MAMTSLDGLLAATLILIGAFSVPLLFPRWSIWGKIAWHVALFATLTLLITQLLGSPISPHFEVTPGSVRWWEQIIDVGWWVFAARSAVGLLRLFIVLEHRPRESRIMSDLIAGAIYVATFLIIVNLVFAFPIAGLLATSGVVAIIVGLALQSTLSDVFSGIAVGVERPYKAGDLLWVEGGIEGHVLEVNWRSTHIATGQNSVAVVPNSVIAKARLVNHSLRSKVRHDTIEVRLDPLVMPERCMSVLAAALRACRLSLTVPMNTVAQVGLSGDGAIYEIGFSVSSHEELAAARNEIYARLQRHLRYAGIALAVPGQAIVPALLRPTPAELLEQSDLFGFLNVNARVLLAEQMHEVWLKSGDILIQQDERPDALFVIASGTIEITTTIPARAHMIRHMSPGASLGAIGLITDSLHTVTAKALTTVQAYRLDREAIAAAVDLRPELPTELEALATRGEAAINRDLATEENHRQDTPDVFLSKMRQFLQRLKSSKVAAQP